jgi:hypothetical protein
MSRVRAIVGVLGVALVSLGAYVAAQDGPDLIGVLVLNGKGYAFGRAQVAIHTRFAKEREPISLNVCAEAAGSPCKLFEFDSNPATRVSTFEYAMNPDDELIGWEVTLTLQTLDGELKPCYAAGTTLPAVLTCGPTPDKQTIRFNLTGGQ